MKTRTVRVGKVAVGGGRGFVLIAGPCVIEDEGLVMETARELQRIAGRVGTGFIFKSSYDKANRSMAGAFRGPGLAAGLRILRRVREELDVPVVSDVHCRAEVEEAAKVLDMIQIPAMLSRQTDLLEAAARSGRPVNVKKGQFLAPWDMGRVVEKLTRCGCEQVVLTERGCSFGYGNLVADMRSLVIMRELGFPVVFDAGHSVQLPGASSGGSGGQRQFVPALARAAAAAGCDALFLEVHPEPGKARCDGANMVPLTEVEGLLADVAAIDGLVRKA